MTDTETARYKQLELLFKAFNDHDREAVMACMTDDIVFFAAAGPDSCGRKISGQNDVGVAFAKTWTDMPDVRWDCKRHAVFGNRGISEWIFRATSPDGKIVEVDGVDLFEFRDNLICSKSAFRKDRPAQEKSR